MVQPTEPTQPVTARDLLLDNLSRWCSLDEVEDFCFRLDINYDNLPGDTIAAKSRELIMYVERRNRIDELAAVGKRLRPDLTWVMPNLPSVRSFTARADEAIPAMPQPVDSIKGLSSTNRLVLEQPFRLELIRVPAGEFLMGSSDSDEAALGHEKPQHRVHLDAYWISRYEITVVQFQAFVSATGHVTIGESEDFGLDDVGTWREVHGADWRHPHGPDSNLADKQDHPVTQVSWDDAVAFCQWLSRMAGQHVQLPSEAQWEKAARGIDGRSYPWGNEWNAKRLNSSASGISDTTTVGRYSPAGDSPYGVADMAGNVWEWTSSLFGLYPYQSEDGREDIHSRGNRVMRGGSWKRGPQQARCSYRSGDPPGFRTSFVGFRVAMQ